MARAKKKIVTPEEQVQNTIAGIVVDSEYKTAATLQNQENLDFESLVDMLEGLRTEKDYQWMSDYSIPELVSILLTDSSGWASQMFQTRDFVEVKLDGEQETDDLKAKAAKKCLNKTLNDRDLYYFPKYMRLRTINSLIGRCYALCWWEQELKKQTITVQKPVKMNVDIQGNPITDPNTQIPLTVMQPVQEEISIPVVDRFNCEILDPRNVFTDNKYCYSIQQKDWVIIRSETSYDKLKADEQSKKYINLDKVKEAIKDKSKSEKTSTEKETYGKDADTEITNTPVHNFDILERYGKFWAVVEGKDSYGNPTKCSPGISDDGMPLEKAELVEMILAFVIIGSQNILIRFIPTDKIDAQGKPYKPIARGLCYIHPTKDMGLSDGKNMGALQVALDDTFNMSSDRVKLATLPVFKGKKYSLEDNSTVYIEPEHVIELENVDDLQELKISSDVGGALNQMAMLTGKMQQVTSIYPTTMGAMPDKASTTATAIAGAETRTNARANYKALTFEYTFLQEFYWIILQMTNRFATDETLIKMLGESAIHFDANADYTYTPVSSNIETEYNKYNKLKLIDQFIGRMASVQNPKTPAMVNYLMSMAFELFDKEFPQYKKVLLDEKAVTDMGGMNQTSSMGPQATSNQSGVPMSNMEMGARESVVGMTK